MRKTGILFKEKMYLSITVSYVDGRLAQEYNNDEKAHKNRLERLKKMYDEGVIPQVGHYFFTEVMEAKIGAVVYYFEDDVVVVEHELIVPRTNAI